MKQFVLTFFLFFLAIHSIFAQNDTLRHGMSQKEKMQRMNAASCRKAYIGFSGGINNPAGFVGFDADIPLAQHVSIGAGFGSGTWGNKIYFDARYYLRPCHRGFALGAGITHCTGEKDFTANLETIYGREKVNLDLHSQSNLFVSAYYFWTLGHKYNRFYLEGGYSVPFRTYRYKQNTGDPLSDRGESTIRVLSPGGLMAGVGFSFGIR